jgi:MFS family permease
MRVKSATRTRYFAGVSRNTVLLAVSSLFADVSTEMLYPILPIFLTQTLKASGSVVGLVEGIAQATQNIVQGFSGSLSDKLQNRKSLALAGYLLSAVAKPLTGLAIAWPGVLGARFLDRLGAGFRSAPRDALIAASVAEENRGRAFGLEGMGDNLGAFLGPLLTVLLFLSLHLDIRWIFYVAVVPALLAFFMILLVEERPKFFSCHSSSSSSPISALRARGALSSLRSYLSSMAYFREYSAPSARHLRRISCQSTCAPVELAGTVRRSVY